MALAETAELAVRLTLKDSLTGPLRNATGALRGFEQRTGLLSQGVSNLARNTARLGAIGVAGLVTQVKFGIDSLRELESVNAQTQAVIESTGQAAGLTATQIRSMAEELETLTTIDDKAIQSAQNLLLTFTSIGKDTFPDATRAVLDMSTALGTDLDTAAIQVGKALQDPVRGMTALRRAGVSFTKEQEQQIKTLVKSGKTLDAQRLILAELSKEFGGSAVAAADTFDGRMRRVGDAVEDAQKALAVGFLPVIEKVSGRLQTFLADPANLARIEAFGRDLSGALDGLIEAGARLPWKQIGDSLQIAGAGARTLLNAFVSLPPWVQTAVITGWGLNKLTGGALGGIVGELGKGLIKGVLGMNAGVVNINAGVVNGAGGMPGTAATSGASRVGKAFQFAAVATGGVAAAEGVKGLQDAVAGALAQNNPEQAAILGRIFDAQRILAFGPFESLRTLPTTLEQLINGPATKAVGTLDRIEHATLGVTRNLGRSNDLLGANIAKTAAIGAAIASMPPPQVSVTVPVSVRTSISVRESQQVQRGFTMYRPPTTVNHL